MYHCLNQGSSFMTDKLADLERRAQQGDASAQNRLGIEYFHGTLVPKNYFKACTWFRKGADQGNSMAQYNLSDMYYNGRGTDKDHLKSYYGSVLLSV